MLNLPRHRWARSEKLNLDQHEEGFQCFRPPLDSIVMFSRVFMTSRAVPQSQDTVIFLFLTAINTLFLRLRKWSKVVTSHYMDEPHFLTPLNLLSSQILPADPQRPSEPNICLTNLLHLSLPWQTGSPTGRANPSRHSVSALCVWLPICARHGEMHLNSVTGPEWRFTPPVGPPSFNLSSVIHPSCQPLTASIFSLSVSDIGSHNQSASITCKGVRGVRLVAQKIVKAESSSSKLPWESEDARSIRGAKLRQVVNDGCCDWDQCSWVKTANLK